jgi:tetratricopeptide (TPR) repeat protein
MICIPSRFARIAFLPRSEVVVDEQEIQIWRALGTLLLGAAETDLGRFDEGLNAMRQGMDLYQGLKSPPVFWPLLLFVEAGAYARASKPTEALSLIDQAIEVAGQGSGSMLFPEFYLLKGDTLLDLHEPRDEAEAWFQRAFDIAHGLGARMPELRAATRLCRLWRNTSKAEQGARVLGALYESFTEGLTTADLTDARRALNGL